jgi:hypothetical protein
MGNLSMLKYLTRKLHQDLYELEVKSGTFEHGVLIVLNRTETGKIRRKWKEFKERMKERFYGNRG